MFTEISFDYTDNNNVTFVDGYTTNSEEGKTLGYIVNKEFYPCNGDYRVDKFIMENVKDFIETLEVITTEDLKQALKDRGYYIDTLWTLDDVQSHLDTYNEQNGTNHQLNDEEAYKVLKNAFDDCSNANEILGIALYDYLTEKNI